MIGLYDWDLITWQQPTVFNLDLMRYSAYLKAQRKVTQMIEDLQDPRVSEWYIFKEYEDSIYPAYLVENPNVHFLGRAVGYNSEIQELGNLTPDVEVYRKMRRYYNTNRRLEFFNKQMNAFHTQLGDDNGNINKNWSRGKERQKVIIFHDKHIESYQDAGQVLTQHLKTDPNIYYGFKYGIQIRDEEHLIQWLSLPLSPDLRQIELNFLPNAEKYLISRPNLADFEFSVGEMNQPELFLFSLLLLQRGNNVTWKDHDVLNQYFAYYIRERNRAPLTFYEYVKFRQKDMLRTDKIILFKKYQKEQPKLFDLFFKTEYVEYDNGQLVPKMYTLRERRERK